MMECVTYVHGVSGGALPVVARGKVLLVPEELGDILPKLLPGDGGAGLPTAEDGQDLPALLARPHHSLQQPLHVLRRQESLALLVTSLQQSEIRRHTADIFITRESRVVSYQSLPHHSTKGISLLSP